MGVTAGLVHVAGARVAELVAAGLSGTGEYVSGDYALMVDKPSVLETDDGLLLVDGTGEITGEDAAIASALGRQVTSATLGSAATVYRVAVTGPGGVLREIVDVEGERQVDTGDPLPQEDATTLLEDETLALFERLTRVTLRDVIDGSLHVLRQGEPAPEPDTAMRKKGFFGRFFGA